jgi:serine/threonine protein kinase
MESLASQSMALNLSFVMIHPSKSIPANVRWMAPEVLGAKSGHVPSVDCGKAADTYSFAVVMFEVCLPCLYI